jgi:hypothetical protein
MHPKGKIDYTWSSKLAYVIGLLTTDGCLSKDGRHVDFTSKDLELIEIFKDYLSSSNKVGRKSRSQEKVLKYFRIQFGDVLFYKFLLEIGLSPAKSKIIGSLKIPSDYFPDFLCGCIDGDGSIRFFQHPESKHPQLRVSLCSASKEFLLWTKNNIALFGITGGFILEGKRAYILNYAKADSIKLLNKIYYNNFPPSLQRKFLVAQSFLKDHVGVLQHI